MPYHDPGDYQSARFAPERCPDTLDLFAPSMRHISDVIADMGIPVADDEPPGLPLGWSLDDVVEP